MSDKTTRTHEEMVQEVAAHFGGGKEVVERALPTPARVDATNNSPHVSIRVKKLGHYGDLPNLKAATIGSAGVDLYAAVYEPVCLNNMGAREIIPTGVSIALPVGYEAQIRPRSGLAANHGLTVLNTPGTIDSDYRGEIKIILINLSTKKFFVERGMRIAQMIVKPVLLPTLEYVDELDDTERGEGHFGSTGL